MILPISPKEIYKYFAHPSFSILCFHSYTDDYHKVVEIWLKSLCDKYKNIYCLKVNLSEFLLQHSEHKDKVSGYDILLIGCEKIFKVLSGPSFNEMKYLFFFAHKSNQLSLEEILNLKANPLCIQYKFLQNECKIHLLKTKYAKMGNLNSSINEFISSKREVDKYNQATFKDPNEFKIFFKKHGKVLKIEPYLQKNKTRK